jgi:hypothetical protein
MLTSHRNNQAVNQNAVENVLTDIRFLKNQFKALGLEQHVRVFQELELVSRSRHTQLFRPLIIPVPL